MIAPEYFNNHIAVEGEIIVKTVNNNTGTVMVWNPITKKISTRTNAEIISDLGLVTTTQLGNYVTIATPQEIEARKVFRPGTGNTYDTASLELRGSNASGIFPTLSFHQPGLYAGTLSYRNNSFHFLDLNGAGYQDIYAKAFIKDGSDGNHVLLGDGSDKPLSDFATSTELGNYLPLSGGTLTSGGRIYDNGNIFVQQTGVGGNATGLFWQTIDNTQFNAGIGAYTENGNFYWHYLGWGAYPWSTGTSLAVGDNIFTYKDNRVWHEGILEDYHLYGLGKLYLETIPNANTFNTKKTGFYSLNETVNAPFQYGTTIKLLRDDNEGVELAISTLGANLAFREYVGGNYSQWYYTWHTGNFNPDNYVEKSGDTMTGTLVLNRTNPNSAQILLSENGSHKWIIESGSNGVFQIAEYGVAERFKITPNALTPTYNGYGLWHAGNFNPDTKVNKSGDTMTGDLIVPNLTLSSNFISSQTLNGSQILAAVSNTIYIGNTGGLDYLVFQSKYELTHHMNGVAGTVWTTHNFNPDNKVSKSGDTMTGGLTVSTPDSVGSNNLGSLPTNLKLFLSNGTQYGTVFWTEGTGEGYIQQQRADGYPAAYRLKLQPYGGELYYGNSEVANHWWINTNFIPKTHPVYNITQAMINTWVTYGYLSNALSGYTTLGYLDSLLTDYAHKADYNVFTKVNTFLLSPEVPAGVNSGDAVNVAQLFEVASTKAVDTVNSKFITEIMNTTFAAYDLPSMGYPIVTTVIAKSDGELRVEELKDGMSLKVRNVSSGNVQVRVNGGSITIVSANEWAEYNSDGTGDITVTSPAGCYII